MAPPSPTLLLTKQALRGLGGRSGHGNRSATKKGRRLRGASRRRTLRRRTLGRSWHAFTRHNHSGGVLVSAATLRKGDPLRWIGSFYAPPNSHRFIPCPLSQNMVHCHKDRANRQLEIVILQKPPWCIGAKKERKNLQISAFARKL
jgi:hypothetical protein